MSARTRRGIFTVPLEKWSRKAGATWSIRVSVRNVPVVCFERVTGIFDCESVSVRNGLKCTFAGTRSGAQRNVRPSRRGSAIVPLELLTAPTFFVLHIAPFQGYHTMQISIRVSIVQVLAGVVVGGAFPKWETAIFAVEQRSGKFERKDLPAHVKTRTLQTPKGSGTPRVSIVVWGQSGAARKDRPPAGRVGHPPGSTSTHPQNACAGCVYVQCHWLVRGHHSRQAD